MTQEENFGKNRSKIIDLCDRIEREILDGKFGASGDNFFTTRELSEKYKISLVSAHKLTMELQKKRLIDLIGKKFFLTYGVVGKNTPRSKKIVRKKMIGIHIPNLESSYFAALARSAEKTCRKNGYQAIICSSSYRYEEEICVLELFERLGTAGVLSCPGRDPKNVDFYRKYTVPTVFMSNRVKGLNNDCVIVDNRNAGKQVARFLIKQKYSSFLYVSQGILRGENDERLEGYSAYLENEGIDFSQDDVIYIDNEFDTFSENKIAKAIMKKEYPVAIFCYNDLLAIAVIRACRKWNFSVPGEIGIVGFDDLTLASDSMQSLTTVHYSTDAIAEESIKLLLSKIDGEKYNGEIKRIGYYLIRRKSTMLS